MGTPRDVRCRGRRHHQGAGVLAFVPLVPGDERTAFETSADVAITERGPNGLIIADTRDEYLPVQFVFPSTETSRKCDRLRHRIGSHPPRDLERSRDAGAMVFSDPVPSQPSGQTSVFFAQPLFAPGAPLETQEQRRAAIVGFASGVLPSASILESVSVQLPGEARISIYDAGERLAATADVPSGGHST